MARRIACLLVVGACLAAASSFAVTFAGELAIPAGVALTAIAELQSRNCSAVTVGIALDAGHSLDLDFKFYDKRGTLVSSIAIGNVDRCSVPPCDRIPPLLLTRARALRRAGELLFGAYRPF